MHPKAPLEVFIATHVPGSVMIQAVDFDRKILLG